jgi:hypothetical protein
MLNWNYFQKMSFCRTLSRGNQVTMYLCEGFYYIVVVPSQNIVFYSLYASGSQTVSFTESIGTPNHNQVWKLYSLEYTDIPKVFFTPHHVGYCGNNVIPGHRCTCVPTVTLGHCCATMCSTIRTRKVI